MTDCFETAAREIVGLVGNIANRPDLREVQAKQVGMICQALRDERERTLEEAAQKCDEAESAHGNDNGHAHARIIRTLKGRAP